MGSHLLYLSYSNLSVCFLEDGDEKGKEKVSSANVPGGISAVLTAKTYLYNIGRVCMSRK